MGNNPNKFLKEPEIKEQLDKFDQLELIILHKLFVDLASKTTPSIRSTYLNR